MRVRMRKVGTHIFGGDCWAGLEIVSFHGVNINVRDPKPQTQSKLIVKLVFQIRTQQIKIKL